MLLGKNQPTVLLLPKVPNIIKNITCFSYPLFFLFFPMRKERITCTPTRKKRRRLLRRANSHLLAIASQIDSSVFSRPQNDEYCWVKNQPTVLRDKSLRMTKIKPNLQSPNFKIIVGFRKTRQAHLQGHSRQ